MTLVSEHTLTVSDKEVLKSPMARLAVAVVLDTSGSMSGKPIEELRRAVDMFFQDVAADVDACELCDIAFIRVGSDVGTLRPFASATVPGLVGTIEADGTTPMGAGIVEAMRQLDRRKAEYSKRGTPYYQPWLVIISDGQPTDDTSEAETRTSDAVRAKKLTVFPVAVGDSVDMARLQRLAGGTPPVRLKGLDFRALFQWLSKSMSVASKSRPGETVELPNPFAWVQL
jgi:hypothetical protein